METVASLARKTCRSHAGRPAITDGRLQYSYEELRERAARLAQALIHRGLQKGDRVAILMSNCLEHIVDRKKDVIISGGANVYPREVEEVLNLHAAVKETCVFGIPDEKWGEAVYAHVVLKEGQKVTEQELIELCKGHLAGFKKPKGILIVDQLPKSSYGKIMRKEIRAEYWGVSQ